MARKPCGIFLLLFVLLLVSCTSAPPPSPTPSSTPIPANTQAPTTPPTSTPTETLPPTPVPIPTDTPQPTSTPEVTFFQDDFSSRTDAWGECENCEWKDDMLYFGPFRPAGVGQDQIFYLLCEACGEHTYYRVAADVTYFEGHGGDRTYGILAGLSGNDFLGAGTITTTQYALYETFDFNSNSWGGTPFRQFSAVRPGLATNRIEVTIKSGSMLGRGDIFVDVNGKNVIVLFNQPVEPSKVGLYLGWHSVGVIYDDFEYEVLESGE